MKYRARREAFRGLLQEQRCTIPASVFDPLSVRIAEEVGYEAAMMAGSTASLTVLGAPDLILLTLSEFAEQARRIGRASSLPLLVDADHGYGNALNVMRAVTELEDAGVAAITIEDTVLPQQFGKAGSTELVSLEEGLGKVRAALSARSDSALTVVARTGAPSVTGLDDAIARCRAYEAAGADAVFLTGIRTRSEASAVCDAVRVPVMLAQLNKDLEDPDFLAQTGVRLALQGHLPILTAISAIKGTMQALRSGIAPRDIQGRPADELVRTVSRQSLYDEWNQQFMTVRD